MTSDDRLKGDVSDGGKALGKRHFPLVEFRGVKKAFGYKTVYEDLNLDIFR
jgi:hypothetical protein